MLSIILGRNTGGLRKFALSALQGLNPGPHYRMSMCCGVMRDALALNAGDLVVTFIDPIDRMSVYPRGLPWLLWKLDLPWKMKGRDLQADT